MTKEVKYLSDKKIEHNIAQVDATFAVEGMSLTDDDKQILTRFAKGKLTIKDVAKLAKDMASAQ